MGNEVSPQVTFEVNGRIQLAQELEHWLADNFLNSNSSSACFEYSHGQQRSIFKVDISEQPFQLWYGDLSGRPANGADKAIFAQFVWDHDAKTAAVTRAPNLNAPTPFQIFMQSRFTQEYFTDIAIRSRQHPVLWGDAFTFTPLSAAEVMQKIQGSKRVNEKNSVLSSDLELTSHLKGFADQSFSFFKTIPATFRADAAPGNSRAPDPDTSGSKPTKR
jgi:hypothetical protein